MSHTFSKILLHFDLRHEGAALQLIPPKARLQAHPYSPPLKCSRTQTTTGRSVTPHSRAAKRLALTRKERSAVFHELRTPGDHENAASLGLVFRPV